MPDRVESFEEVNSSENRPRPRSGFVKPIRNGLRKEQTRVDGPERKPTLWEEKMESNSRKKGIRNRSLRSNSFDTEKVREIGRKKAGYSRGFPIL